MDVNYRYLQKKGDYSIVRYEGMYPLYLYITNDIDKAKDSFDFYKNISDLGSGNECKSLKLELNSILGFTILVSTKKDNCLGVLIYLKDIDKDEVYKTISHESVHCADAIFQYIGAYSQDYDNTDEPYAYLVEWCFSCAYDYIQCKRSNNSDNIKIDATDNREKK